MVSGSTDSSASEGGWSSKPTVRVWKTIRKFFEPSYLCRIKDGFVRSWLIIIFQMHVPCCLIKSISSIIAALFTMLIWFYWMATAENILRPGQRLSKDSDGCALSSRLWAEGSSLSTHKFELYYSSKQSWSCY